MLFKFCRWLKPWTWNLNAYVSRFLYCLFQHVSTGLPFFFPILGAECFFTNHHCLAFLARLVEVTKTFLVKEFTQSKADQLQRSANDHVWWKVHSILLSTGSKFTPQTTGCWSFRGENPWQQQWCWRFYYDPKTPELTFFKCCFLSWLSDNLLDIQSPSAVVQRCHKFHIVFCGFTGEQRHLCTRWGACEEDQIIRRRITDPDLVGQIGEPITDRFRGRDAPQDRQRPSSEEDPGPGPTHPRQRRLQCIKAGSRHIAVHSQVRSSSLRGKWQENR